MKQKKFDADLKLLLNTKPINKMKKAITLTNKENEIFEIFVKKYKDSKLYDGMIPTNSSLLDYQNNSDVMYSLVDMGLLEKRVCDGMAYQLTQEERNKIDGQNPTTTPKETAPTEGKKEDEPKDLIDWIGKKGLSDTKDILNELKVINLTKENESLKARNKELLEAMTDLVERVNRARGILQDPKGNHHGNWGMLDTTNAKEKIEANQIK